MSVQAQGYVKTVLSPDEIHGNMKFLAGITDEDAALLAYIGRQILIARKAHPNFAATFEEASRVVESEFLEFKSKVLANRIWDAHGEAEHCIVTLFRLINQEYAA